jgi:hypothetical protein
MCTKFREAVCDEHGIGGSGEYSGGSDSLLGRINVLSISNTMRSLMASVFPARCSSTSSPA